MSEPVPTPHLAPASSPDNARIARVLLETARLLEIQGENRFKVQAYEKAAREVASAPERVADLAQAGRLGELKGVGKGLAPKLEELARTGTMAQHQALLSAVPPGVLAMLEVPGLGPKRAKVLWAEHGVCDVESLDAACRDGRVAAFPGFGAALAKKLLEGIGTLAAQRAKRGGRARLDRALATVRTLVGALRACPDVVRASEAGSARRRCETVKDVDLVASSAHPERVMDAFAALPGVVAVESRGPTKITVALEGGLKADLRVTDDSAFTTTLVHLTGSKAHNVRLRELARTRGMKISEYAVERDGVALEIADEPAFFAALGLAYVPPELREDAGEVEAAAAGTIPHRLVEATDLAGALHNHTDWSDGSGTLLEMATAARDRGWKYLAITDHSRSSGYAGGLSPERLVEQLAVIAGLNASFAQDPDWRGFRLLTGSEVDILPDGTLDYEDELLARLDVVVASVHSRFQQPLEEMTARVKRAIANPLVGLLGHPTGRLLLEREPYALDVADVVREAARVGCGIEINASPRRLELDWIHARLAASLGVAIAINPDAHTTGQLAHVELGATVARRAWLGPDQVLNTHPWEVVRARLHARRHRA